MLIILFIGNYYRILGGYYNSSFICSLLFFLLTSSALSVLKSNSAWYYIVLPVVLIQTITLLLAFNGNDLYSPGLPLLLSPYIGILLGILYNHFSSKLILMPIVAILYLYSYQFFPAINHKLINGNFNGKEHIVIPNWTEQHTIASSFEILGIDFWSSSCISCFRYFGDLNNLHEKYLDNATVEILSMAAPIESRNETLEQLKNIIRERGYSFPVIEINDETIKKLKIDSYPVYMIFKQDTIIYRTHIYEKFQNEMDNMLDRNAFSSNK